MSVRRVDPHKSPGTRWLDSESFDSMDAEPGMSNHDPPDPLQADIVLRTTTVVVRVLHLVLF